MVEFLIKVCIFLIIFQISLNMTVNKHEICQNEPNKFPININPRTSSHGQILVSHHFFFLTYVISYRKGAFYISRHDDIISQSDLASIYFFFVKLKITLYLAVYIIQSYVHLLDSKIAQPTPQKSTNSREKSGTFFRESMKQQNVFHDTNFYGIN